MIQNIFFDLDETILDFHKAERIALQKALELSGIEPEEKILNAYKHINLAQWKRLELGELTREEVKIIRYQILFEQFDIDVKPEMAARFYEEKLAEGHFFVGGALELLKALHGLYKLYIVSNGSSHIQRSRIASAGIEKYLEHIFVSEDVGFNKPSKEFFDVIFKQLPYLKKEETVIVGDSLTSDIRGGINAGIHTIWFRRNDTTGFGEIIPEYEVGSLDEIPNLLKQI